MTDISEKLLEAKAEVERLERAMLSATCKEAGHDWRTIGGANAGCGLYCGCSVPVYVCSKCNDSDYGDNSEADEIRTNCASRFSNSQEWES